MANSVMGDLSSQLLVAFHRLQDWAYPDEIDHEMFQASSFRSDRKERMAGARTSSRRS